MNWRAIGCGGLAIVGFIGIGVWGLVLAMGEVGCPPSIQWGDRTYAAAGPPTDHPIVGTGEPSRLGTTLVGALSREVYGPEGSTPSPNAVDRPTEVAVACGDGTFVTYRYDAAFPVRSGG
jgi:hypothetical protein